jgi:hypothetical protein
VAGGSKRLLKRWRENYYLSQFLTSFTKPLYFLSCQVARHIERKVRKNTVTIRLPNGKDLSIGRNSGIGIASHALLAWIGWF